MEGGYGEDLVDVYLERVPHELLFHFWESRPGEGGQIGAALSRKGDIGADQFSGPVGIMNLYRRILLADEGWRLALQTLSTEADALRTRLLRLLRTYWQNVYRHQLAKLCLVHVEVAQHQHRAAREPLRHLRQGVLQLKFDRLAALSGVHAPDRTRYLARVLRRAGRCAHLV